MLRQVLYHALLNDHPGVRIEQRCASDRQLRPGDFFHPSFQNGKPGYFDITVRNTLQPAFLMRGAEQAGVAAEAGVAVKDHLHAAAVEESAGEFYKGVLCTANKPPFFIGGTQHPLVLPHRRRVVWCVGSVLPRHATRDRVASHHPHRTAKTPGPHQPHAAVVCSPLEIYNARLLRSQLDLSDDVRGWDLAG